MNPQLSVLIPSYNVSSKIQRCFESLDALRDKVSETEVIFVDDCSTDETYSKITEYAASRPWVKFQRLDRNTGTPSVPRNIAFERSRGKYIFHLDPDDEVLAEGIKAEIDLAELTNADAVRAPLIRFDGAESTVMNRISGWSDLDSRLDRQKAIVKLHSTTVCSLYRRDFLERIQLRWPEDLRLAEDAIYLYTALSHGDIEYSDEPDFIYHVSVDPVSTSSTQQYQDRELENHLRAWSRSTNILEPAGIDYFALRGQIALQAAFHNMIRFNDGGLSRQNVEKLSEFLLHHESAVRRFTFGARFKELVELLLEKNYDKFLDSIKLRLLIAGYDLRFILPAIPYLESHFQVRVDEWTGHEIHDETKSEWLLSWADAIHCEWMLGNAVWYSERKLPRQTLQVRLHRFETTRDYGSRMNLENVDRVITIAPAMFEETIEVFNFPRELVRYAPNYLEIDDYLHSDEPSKVFNLAMVGSIPIRKGYRRGLELLKMLREVDNRYTLTVFGRRPDELGWVYNDPVERDYFTQCELFIRQNGLESAVKFEGWIDTKIELANKGFVLSMSDAEGSHQAAAEGFASKNITLLRPWVGAEFMYPNQYIFNSLEAMRDYVLECREFKVFKGNASSGHTYVREKYSMDRFVELYKRFLPVPASIL